MSLVTRTSDGYSDLNFLWDRDGYISIDIFAGRGSETARRNAKIDGRRLGLKRIRIARDLRIRSLFEQLYLDDILGIMALEKPIFRLRFRVPICFFYDLVERVRTAMSRDFFARWKNRPLSQPALPVKILVLAGLRMMGMGSMLDQLSEVTLISKDTINVFYKEFLRWGATDYFQLWVRPPNKIEEAKKVARVFGLGGQPGCVASVDVTHIKLENFVKADRHMLVGKEGYPSLAFLTAVTHSGRFQHVS